MVSKGVALGALAMIMMCAALVFMYSAHIGSSDSTTVEGDDYGSLYWEGRADYDDGSYDLLKIAVADQTLISGNKDSLGKIQQERYNADGELTHVIVSKSTFDIASQSIGMGTAASAVEVLIPPASVPTGANPIDYFVSDSCYETGAGNTWNGYTELTGAGDFDGDSKTGYSVFALSTINGEQYTAYARYSTTDGVFSIDQIANFYETSSDYDHSTVVSAYNSMRSPSGTNCETFRRLPSVTEELDTEVSKRRLRRTEEVAEGRRLALTDLDDLAVEMQRQVYKDRPTISGYTVGSHYTSNCQRSCAEFSNNAPTNQQCVYTCDSNWPNSNSKWVVIEGSKTTADWLNDFSAFPVSYQGMKVHYGFKKESERLDALVNAAYNQVASNNGKLVLMGHSLGGVIADIQSTRLQFGSGVSACKMALVTIGAPAGYQDSWLSSHRSGYGNVPHTRIVSTAMKSETSKSWSWSCWCRKTSTKNTESADLVPYLAQTLGYDHASGNTGGKAFRENWSNGNRGSNSIMSSSPNSPSWDPMLHKGDSYTVKGQSGSLSLSYC